MHTCVSMHAERGLMKYRRWKYSLLPALCAVALLALLSCTSQEPPLTGPSPSSTHYPNTPPQPSPSPANSNTPNDVRYLVINLPGQKVELPVNDYGELTTDAEVKSADGVLSLFIDSGTSFLDESGKPVYSVAIKVNTNSLSPPENTSIIGTTYEFSPDGVTCTLPLKFSLNYNPDSLPPEVVESEIYLACYADGKWNQVGGTVIDTEGHSAEAQIDHFCWYTILAPLPSGLSPTTSPPDTPAVSVKVDLLYFHPSVRCTTCKYFEERIRYVLSAYFQKEIDAGRLELKLFDYLDKANADLVKKYQVVGSQLCIRTEVNGVERIRNVWEIYQWGSHEEAFDKGLRAIIQESLEGAE